MIDEVVVVKCCICGLERKIKRTAPGEARAPKGWKNLEFEYTPGSHSFWFELLYPLFNCNVRAGFALIAQFGAFTAKSPSPAAATRPSKRSESGVRGLASRNSPFLASGTPVI